MAYGAFTGKLEAVNQMLSTIGQSRISQLATAGEANDAQKILEEIDKAVQSEGWHFNIFYDVELARGSETITCAVTNTTTVTTKNGNDDAPHYLSKGETVTIGDTNYTVASVTNANAFVASAGPTGTSMGYTKRIGTPTTALNIDFSSYRYGDIDPVVRGRFIYDKRNATYEYSEDLKAIITYQIPFEQNSSGGEALPEYARRYITMKAARVFAQRHVGDPQLVQMASYEEREAHAQFIQADSENAETNVFNASLPYYTVSRGQAVQSPSISNLYKV